jgi:hypothetical protein
MNPCRRRWAPLHRHQHRAAPLAAHSDALHDPEEREQDRRRDTDAGVAREHPHERRRDAHEGQRRDQGALAAEPVAVMAEDRRADRSSGEPDELGGEREQGAGEDGLPGEETAGKTNAAAVP